MARETAAMRKELLGVPLATARECCVFPVAGDGKRVTVLAADAADPALRDKLAFVLNRDVDLVGAPAADIRQRIEQGYAADPPASAATAPPSPSSSARRETVQTRLGQTEILSFDDPQPPPHDAPMSWWGRLLRSRALARYARRIIAKVRDTNPQRPSGLYDHEPFLRQLGGEIHARYGLRGMQDVFQIVHRRKGGGATSELGRIWRNVGDWRY